jgi:polysaccharide export outer membrane protein
LLTAGSFNQLRANTDKVELLRLNPNGTVSRRTIEVDFSQGLNPNNNPTLRNNDVILVARSGYTRVGDNINRFLQPIAGAATGLSAVSGVFSGFETTINAVQNLFLGGDFERRNQLREIREQRQDRQEQREDRLLERELQREDRERQRNLENQQLLIQQQQLLLQNQQQQMQPQQIQPTP